LNCALPATVIVKDVGEMKIEVSVALETLRLIVPETPFTAAVMVVEPVATPVASPGFCCPEVSIVAVALDEELHVAELVRFFVEPSV
jgi:hypothetical protein